MNVFVSILKILIIILAIGVAAVVLLMGAMVIFPGFSLFGIHYVSGDSRSMGYYYDVTATDADGVNNVEQWAAVDKVLIVTDSWDISLRAVTENDTPYNEVGIETIVRRNYRGFATNDVSTAEFSGYTFEERSDGYYMIMTMTEPTGFISKTNASVSVLLNSSLLADKDLIIQTNGGKVTLGNKVEEGSVTTSIENLEINSSGGEVDLRDVTISNMLTVNKKSGNLYVTKDLNCGVELNIASGYGRAEFLNIGTESSSKDLIIQNLYNSTILFDTIYGNFSLDGSGGYVVGDCVQGAVLVNAQTCDVRITDVNGVIDFTNRDGSLTVKNANSNVFTTITNGDGSVNITNLLAESNIATDSGAVNIEQVNSNISVKSNSGRIQLTNAEGRQINYVIEATDSEVILNDVNGSVNFNTLNRGRASIKVTYQALIGSNNFVTQSGAIDITFIPANYAFLLQGWSTANSVSFKLSNFEEYTINNNLDREDYANGIAIGGYNPATDGEKTLTLISNTGAIKVEQLLNNEK